MCEARVNALYCSQEMSAVGRRHVTTAKINQVVDESRWKEKIVHERKAKEYWENIYKTEHLVGELEL